MVHLYARITGANSNYLASIPPLILLLNYARQGEWGNSLE